MELWSNIGETVVTPFMGVGSEVYGAIINGRKALGCELKPSYFKQAKKILAATEEGWRDAGYGESEGLKFDEPDSDLVEALPTERDERLRKAIEVDPDAFDE